jgi:hypothetical protein
MLLAKGGFERLGTTPTFAETLMRRVLATILAAGLTAGTLDITAALAVYTHFDARSELLLQGIASGVLGKHAFDGGVPTALLGLGLHFAIAMSWALLYYFANRSIIRVRTHPISSGILYGLVVYGVMNHIVIPLSAIGPQPFVLSDALVAAGLLVLCIGLPISLVVERMSANI